MQFTPCTRPSFLCMTSLRVSYWLLKVIALSFTFAPTTHVWFGMQLICHWSGYAEEKRVTFSPVPLLSGRIFSAVDYRLSFFPVIVLLLFPVLTSFLKRSEEQS